MLLICSQIELHDLLALAEIDPYQQLGCCCLKLAAWYHIARFSELNRFLCLGPNLQIRFVSNRKPLPHH